MVKEIPVIAESNAEHALSMDDEVVELASEGTDDGAGESGPGLSQPDPSPLLAEPPLLPMLLLLPLLLPPPPIVSRSSVHHSLACTNCRASLQVAEEKSAE